MTDRAKALVVHLNDDYRLGDDADRIMDAIGMVRGVLAVEPLTVTTEDHLEAVSVACELCASCREPIFVEVTDAVSP